MNFAQRASFPKFHSNPTNWRKRQRPVQSQVRNHNRLLFHYRRFGDLFRGLSAYCFWGVSRSRRLMKNVCPLTISVDMRYIGVRVPGSETTEIR